MWTRFSVSGPIPPRIPKIVWTNSGGLTRPRSSEVGQVVEVAHVVALELEPRPALVAESRRIPSMSLNVLRKTWSRLASRCVASHVIPERFVAIEHREEAEVHRAHVERGELRLCRDCPSQAFLERHARPAARRDVDDRITLGADLREELHEHVRVRRRPTVAWVAGVKMEDGCAGLRRLDGLISDLPGVMGRYGDMVGVWIEPVTAQLMMTFDCPAAMVSPFVIGRRRVRPCPKAPGRPRFRFRRGYCPKPEAQSGLVQRQTACGPADR